MPKRVQLSRAKGWRMPANTVKVARPCLWGNPFVIGRDGVKDARQAVQCFEDWLMAYVQKARPFRIEALEALRGKNLACWCRLDQPCHADVLLRLANDEPPNVAGNRLARQGQSELTGVLGACNEKRGNDGKPTTDE